MTVIPSLAETLASLFVGRVDTYAEETPSGGFSPVERPVMPADLARHLSGERGLGFYPVQPGDTVVVAACDWDAKHEPDWRERAVAVYATLAEYGLSSLLEISQSGAGAHVWLRFNHPVAASAARRLWQDVLVAAGVSCREIFPKQENLVSGLGNLIRYPLWKHSRFVSSAGVRIPPDRALASWVALDFAAARKAIPEAVSSIVQPDGDLAELPPRLARALASGIARRAWDSAAGGNDKSRSGAAMRLACALVRARIPTDEIDAGLVAWGKLHGVEDKTERTSWRRMTVDAAYDFVLRDTDAGEPNLKTAQECVADYLSARKRGRDEYCPFGIPSMDEQLEGLAYGEFGLLASRPSRGKTALALQWTEAQTRRGVPVLFVSEEMTHRKLGGRMVRRARGGQGDDGIGPDSPDIIAHFAKTAPCLVRCSCRTITAVEQAVSVAVEKHNVRAVVVDYAQLLRGSFATARTDALADVSTRLKQLTLEYDIALLAAAQLNRQIESRNEGFTPNAKMSDIRDSGQFEQDADLILMLHRPWWDDKAAPQSDLRVQLVKRRDGPMRFRELQVYYDLDAQIIS